MSHAPRKERAFSWGAMLLLCLIIVVSTADRQIIALIKPVLDQTFGWSVRDYARISFWTQVASACSLLISGWLVDRLGSRRVLGAALAGWSLMTILHAVVTSVRAFVLVRATLGALEGAGMPSLMKLIATRVPRAERARVIGLVNAVPNGAAVVTPVLAGLLLPWIGWKALVVALGLVGLLLAGFWWRDQAGPWGAVPSGVQDEQSQSVSVESAGKVLGQTAGFMQEGVGRFVAVFALCKVLSDATWWVLLYWLPDILHTHLGLSLRGVGVVSGGVYLGAGLGAFAGGLLPNLFQTILRSREHARRLVMGGAALCVVPMLFVYDSHTVFVSMGVFALALMAHQVFATNLFALMTEWAPGFLVGRIMGIGAFCGNLGGAGLLWLTGRAPMPFVLGLCSLSYLVAWGVLWVWASPDWLERVLGAPGQGGGAQTGLSRQEWNAARAPVDGMVPAVVHGH